MKTSHDAMTLLRRRVLPTGGAALRRAYSNTEYPSMQQRRP
jgi:hypothetical protein